MGDYARRSTKTIGHLNLSLQKAHIALRPDVYLSYSYLNMLVALLASVLLDVALVAMATLGYLRLPETAYFILLPLPLLLAIAIYLLTLALPDLRALNRARDIDAKLPYALNYVATLASAGTPIQRIFATLGQESVYGEVARESAWIARDTELLGRDIVAALSAAVERSPSLKFQDLVQGAIIAVTSGADLKTYFAAKSEQFGTENRQDHRRFLESLGVLSESFVTVVVAAPLLLMVLLSVMTMFGASGRHTLFLGYMLIFGMIPLVQVGFALAIRSITPET